jgi:monoterpene epsilon-lactone hydrolase
MTNANMMQKSIEAPLPEAPSLRARIVTRVVRLVVKRWPRGDYKKVVMRARRIFNAPNPISQLFARGVHYEALQGTDLRGEWVIPDAKHDESRVLLYLHGGGYVSCNARTHRPITASLARRAGQRVLTLDYRLAPEFPFPAAVDDAARAYTWLLETGIKPENITIAGDSAGGGLVLATMLRLKANQQPLPARAACLCPWVDLTGSGSYRNGENCAMFRPEDGGAFAALYLNGAAANLPEASPIFGDLTGLPPLLIHISTTELLFDEALRLHEKANKSGVESTLRAYPGLPHDWHLFLGIIPEAETALKEVAAFIKAD